MGVKKEEETSYGSTSRVWNLDFRWMTLAVWSMVSGEIDKGPVERVGLSLGVV